MNLLDKLIQQVKDGRIKPKDTLQDWLDTLKEDDLEELERLVTLQEEDPENEETEIIGQLVDVLYSIESGTFSVDDDGVPKTAEIEEAEFFNLLNSFLFMLPFYYWLKQDLIKVSTKLSFQAIKSNDITVTITEYGK